METAPVERRASRVSGKVALAGALAGGVAGGICLLLEMLYGLFSGSRSFFDAPMAMFAWVFGIGHYTRNSPGDHIWPVILGMIGFVVLMAILGIVFAAIMSRIPNPSDATTLVAGIAFAAVVWAILRYVVVPLNGGEDALITSSAVSPQWYWWLSFLAGGVGLGVTYDVEHRLEPEWWGEPQRTRPARTTTVAGGL